MDKVAEVARIEREAVEVRLMPADLCRLAQVNPSTWWRVRQKPEKLTLRVLGKLEVAIRNRRKELADA